MEVTEGVPPELQPAGVRVVESALEGKVSAGVRVVQVS